MATRRNLLVMGVAAASALALAACGATADKNEGGSSNDGKPVSGLRIMVPNTPGGGYDTTARTAAKVMEDAKIATGVQVFNLPGAGGTVGLQRTVNEKGNGKLAMQMGLGVVGASYTSKSSATLTQTTPLAKMIEEAGAIVVPKDSPYKTIGDLVAAWKANPKGLAVGGGSSPGGPDHLLPMQLAKTVGIDPRQVNFVSYDGGGELLPAVLGGKVAFGASGFGEFLDQVEAGQIRVLAVTSEAPIDALKDVPTLKSAGIDLVFTNWRGIVAPPGISDADKKVWIDVLTKMHESEEWKAELAKRGWTDAFVTGDEFGTFLTEQDKAVADVLKQLGLA
ncbi:MULTISPECIES: tripartite tricarboxylate transporter substrate binding protein [Micromonospora]|uniref:C4-dicarboxylate ABC transporter substrate-binding protein n=1 Tax=Micromonospora sicca TaxID=2202420 RepID=A0A317DD67_9ACTN|nr:MULTISPECIES: tripartite tricarboxylate transporter substrate binding protein [unclassified Micromonospora]MBM0225415.1 tripartite tricarboxylate transporter substrate binding protein [Micromonospora sp. ATA51]MDZ5444607.1 tripartite tricarboxylate transporter substrate binding protein [Micromonospora sp. 4G57]MDZ5488592.1 tripartite tricarboxylate transporter substrate binding protein [Micromonospora sp. 4G53]PWR12771.1 C4-dicarboxylate ABC transporter substrate-binding protein [Micromonosp